MGATTTPATGRLIGWYRIYDAGELGVQIMHYKLDGSPGQCCTVTHDRLAENIAALETPWPQGRADVEPMYWARHDAPFSYEMGRRLYDAEREAAAEGFPFTALRRVDNGFNAKPAFVAAAE